MSLPEKVWWCQLHKTTEHYVISGVRLCAAGGFLRGCPVIEVELHPVGSRVAGPDDLVIRRDADGNWPMRVLAEISVELEARRLTGLDEWSVQSIVELALAAAEGGEE